ncbi:NO-inducible flavohemoprotein [Shewanella surugensis]|uniref:nitric oxide dioxygenase n=1 Tax=Shewanella surugensis TaxID=212020 RepID=A0ABT0LAY4_9GAMM|nr:NO-inducible flavohemoprotein [Shewanella surugensis]MCL1124525.1 NO-inducible flavohemoprotein [Shewanella surugensis]
MLSENTIKIVKSTVPLLVNAGTGVTEYFYNRMFTHNPELKDIFNMGNQETGKQPFALFNALAAFAQHIDNLDVLKSALSRISHKHTSLNILPEHYPIVGLHLIETLRELLPDAFTPEVEQAWTEAYALLADLCITQEHGLYQQNAEKQGGWLGARGFIISQKQPESEQVTSFTLTPKDGGQVAEHIPGQYLGIKVKPTDAEYMEIRQYSISDKVQTDSYRISIKKECNEPQGIVSNYLHSLSEGSEVDIFPPAGDFYLQFNDKPVVLISAGVGLTPMMSMLETLVEAPLLHSVHYLHACENNQQHSFAKRVNALCATHDKVDAYTWYNKEVIETGIVDDRTMFTGLMELSHIKAQLPIEEGDYYVCGPNAFMSFIKKQLLLLGVDHSRIHYEVFGPHEAL